MPTQKPQTVIRLPYKFTPRSYQLPLLRAMDNGATRAVVVWHRRAGKDKTCFNYFVRRAATEVGIYYYFFPTYAQGKKALWDAIDKEGFKVLNHIPEQLMYSKNDTEMKIVLRHPKDAKQPGSIIQVIGTDNIDSIVGTNPRGCVFSEYSLQDPRAWDMIKPILEENGGWAMFDFTPRGENHAYDLLQLFKKKMDQGNPKYFAQVLTVEDTEVLSLEQVEEIREEDIAKNGDDSVTEQEWFCSFTASVQGAYYYQWLKDLEEQGRISDKFEYNPKLKVHTAWDIGVDDHTSIWFFQIDGEKVNFIDYLEGKNQGLSFYSSELKKLTKELGYKYGKHIGPHDLKQREWANSTNEEPATRADIASEKYGIEFEVLHVSPVADGIEASRELLRRSNFHKTKCKTGLRALKAYHKKFDEKKKTYINTPEHDWSSHPSDAFRYAANGIEIHLPIEVKPVEEVMEEMIINQSNLQAKAFYEKARQKHRQDEDEYVATMFN